MSYASHSDSRSGSAHAVPFSEFTAPMMVIGESVYTAFEMASKAVYQGTSAIVRSWQRHRSESQLRALDDRTLQDIGVSRSEIRYLAKRVSEDPNFDFRRHSGQ